jgi:hypothetical protein
MFHCYSKCSVDTALQAVEGVQNLRPLHWLQVATLIDQRVAEVLESDAVKESLQARLEAERKVCRAWPRSVRCRLLNHARRWSRRCRRIASPASPPVYNRPGPWTPNANDLI